MIGIDVLTTVCRCRWTADKKSILDANIYKFLLNVALN